MYSPEQVPWATAYPNTSNQSAMMHSNYRQPARQSPMHQSNGGLNHIPDRDVFITGSTFYSVRVEQSGQETSLPNGYSQETHDTMHEVPGDLQDDENTENMARDVLANDYDQLLMEMEYLRRENTELRESFFANGMEYRNGNGHIARHDTDVEEEELVEEEVHTIHHNPPQLIQEEIVHRTEKNQDSYDRSRYHLLDLTQPTIEANQFPQDYWTRLVQKFRELHVTETQHVTREVGLQSPGAIRNTVATTVTAPSCVGKQCFGVTVRPCTRDAPVMTDGPSTREFGCTTVETASMIRDWVNKRSPNLTIQQRQLLSQLVHSSSSSREKFVELLSQSLFKSTRNASVHVKPEGRLQYTGPPITGGLSIDAQNNVSASPPQLTPAPVQMESKLIEVRPVLMHKSSMTVRSILTPSVGVETEAMLLRSQGSQASMKLPDMTACGVQTTGPNPTMNRASDPISPNMRRVTTAMQTVLHQPISPPFVSKETASPLQQSPRLLPVVHRDITGGHVEQIDGDAVSSVVRVPHSPGVTTSKSLASMVEQLITTGSTVTRSTRIQSSRPMTPDELNQYFPEGIAQSSVLITPAVINAEDRMHGSPYPAPTTVMATKQTSPSYTVSTERRVVDEHSERHILPEDVDLNSLTYGGPSVLDGALSRAKHLSTSRTIREFEPSVEVRYSTDEQSQSQISGTGAGMAMSGSSRVGTTIPSDVKSFEIPVKHVTDIGETSHSTTFAERLSTQSSTPTSPRMPHTIGASWRTEPGERGSASGFTAKDVPPSYSRTEYLSGAPGGVISGSSGRMMHSSSRESTRLPPRNHTYLMPMEVTRACESLATLYQTGKSVNESTQMEHELDRLSTILFQLIATSRTNYAQFQDYITILDSYHPRLAQDVIQSTNNQGSTCLHLAVGHGAWSVVNLILDSGYAEPNRLNRAGYSAIMITAVSKQCNAASMSRLFNAGDVNIRSGTDTAQTALMLAAQSGSVEVVALLVKHGALENLQDRAGNTALMFAIQQNNMEVVRLLLERPGLDLSLKDNRGEDALAIAVRCGGHTAIDLLKRYIDTSTHIEPILCPNRSVPITYKTT